METINFIINIVCQPYNRLATRIKHNYMLLSNNYNKCPWECSLDFHEVVHPQTVKRAWGMCL